MEKIEGLSIGLDLDSLKVERGLKGLKDRLKTVNSEMKSNMSAFDRSDQSLSKYETRLQGLNKKLGVQKQVTKEARAEYDKMVREHGEGSKQAEKAAREYNNQAAALNNLDRYVGNARKELEQMRKEQEFANSRWGKLSQNLGDFSGKLDSAGQKMTSAGRTMTMGLTLPIMGMGAAAMKTGADFEAAMSEVQATSGATGEDLEKLEGLAKDMGATTRFSASESAEALKYMSLAGWDTQQMMNGLPGVLDLAAAGNMELARASDIVTDTMSMYKMEAEQAGHASDVFAYAQANANTNVEQMGEAMKYAGPVANSLGISFEDTAGAMMVLADSGLKGSMAGQAFASSLGRLAKPTKQMKGTMEELSLSFFDAEGNMKSMPDIIKEIEDGTQGMNKEQKSAALTTLFGAEAYKHWSVLLEGGSETLADNTKELENANGAAGEMAETMSDNARGKMKEFTSALEGLSIMASEHLLPPFTKIVETATEWIRKFGEMEPKTQKNILAVAGLAAAIGPLSIVMGTTLRTVGLFTGGLSRSIRFFGMMGKSSKDTRKELNTFGGTAVQSGDQAVKSAGSFNKASGSLTKVGKVAGVASLGLGGLMGPMSLLATMAIPELIKGGKKLHDHLQEDSIPAVEDFGDKVSDSTTEAVLGYKKLNDEATAELNELFWSGQEITDENSQKLVNTFEEMTSQISTAMETKFDESYQTMQEFFANSKELSEKEQEEMLTGMQESHEERKKTLQEQLARIKEIRETAAEENRGITREEQREINRIQKEMKATAVQTMTESEVEQKAIMERLRNDASKITARQAADTVKNSKEAKDGAVKEAEEKYQKVVQNAILQRDETGAWSKEEADTVIEEAKRQRDESVKKAEEMHRDVVAEAKEQAEDHVDEVNWATGEILSKWDQFSIDFTVKLGEIGGKALSKWGEMKEDAIEGGKGITSGIVEGIDDGDFSVMKAIRGVASNLIKTFKKKLGIRSPSRVFKGMGVHIIEGLSQGLSWGNLKDIGVRTLQDYGGGLKEGWNNVKGFMTGLLGGGGSVGGDVGSWLMQAIGLTGVPSSWLGPLSTIAKHESGGNPRAQNNWDINAKRGIPSKGLMQTIGPTFNANKLPGLSDIFNPVHNAAAAIQYIKRRYGSVFNVPGIKAMARGGSYVGYETGGFVKNRGLYELAEGGHGEWIIPTDPARRTDAQKLLALAGKDIDQGNKRPNQLASPAPISEQGSHIEKFIELLQMQLNETQNAVQLLSRILQKDNKVYLGQEQVTNAINSQNALNDLGKYF
ncbi:phage tail tape measure protein [Halobacillus karajensis]|uniref:phage tail tape measure protein n=1 Tax=Halobacillus karajensis TaxID=195088 RepID=UPI00045CC6A1|nr:phage tail tape measure protein [Halobacillus karajensis]CDQ17940.1 phage tail tape measure protein, TP901 family, core region [Halobacillus karajensis]